MLSFTLLILFQLVCFVCLQLRIDDLEARVTRMFDLSRRLDAAEKRMGFVRGGAK